MISKSMVRQRLISSHGNLAGKLGVGMLGGHPQVLSHYQYEGGVPMSGGDGQESLGNHFPSGREPGLLYHCFKHRGKERKQSAAFNRHLRYSVGLPWPCG